MRRARKPIAVNAIIKVRDLTFAYPQSAPVLEHFSFTLTPGERVTLTGPNGSGKTTFLHVLLGFLRPTAGSVEVLGEQCENDADFADARRALGMVFQDSNDQVFCPTVWEDVAFGPANLGMKGAALDARVSVTLARLGIEGLRDKPTHHLSHGQRRMVALAGVLAMEPRAILLDEPTAGLDHASESRLLEVLTALPQELLIVSHNKDFMRAIETRRVTLGG
jgi:cobalt/nickel transport system ATP-binding protein